MAHPVKVATPEEALTVVPPLFAHVRTAPDVPVPPVMARATGTLEVVTTLPLESSTWTVMLNEPDPVAWIFWPELGSWV
jgi:hypothetical protein